MSENFDNITVIVNFLYIKKSTLQHIQSILLYSELFACVKFIQSALSISLVSNGNTIYI